MSERRVMTSRKSVCSSSSSTKAFSRYFWVESQSENRKSGKDKRRRSKKHVDGTNKHCSLRRAVPHLEMCYVPKLEVLLGFKNTSKSSARPVDMRGFIFDVNDGIGTVLCPLNLAYPRVHIFFDKRTQIEFIETQGAVEKNREKILVPGTTVEVTFVAQRGVFGDDEEVHSIIVCQKMVVEPVLNESKEKGAVISQGGISRREKRNRFRPVSMISGSIPGKVENLLAYDQFCEDVIVHPQIHRSQRILDAFIDNCPTVRVSKHEFWPAEYYEATASERTLEGLVIKAPEWVKKSASSNLFVQGVIVAIRPYGEYYEGFACLNKYTPTEMVLDPLDLAAAAKLGKIRIQRTDITNLNRKSKNSEAFGPAVQTGAIYRFGACKEMPGEEHEIRIYGLEFVAPPGSQDYAESVCQLIDTSDVIVPLDEQSKPEEQAQVKETTLSDLISVFATMTPIEETKKTAEIQSTGERVRLIRGYSLNDDRQVKRRRYFNDLLLQYDTEE